MQDITASELKQRIEAGESPHLIDVRDGYEHEEFNIGGTNLPLGDIMQWSEVLDLPQDQEIVVYCRSGNRSGMAKSVLMTKGYSAVRNLTGGVLAWQEE
jgi:rhodanese-related sulfurtransferase